MRAPESPDVTVVIPCYNEAHRLNREAFRAYLSSDVRARLLFVDDGSTDNTVQVLASVCQGFESHAAILRCSVNRGKAEAVRFGILHALQHHDPDIVGFWDADLATPLSAIDQLVKVLDEKAAVMMVFGSRIKLLGRDVQRDLLRHYLGRIFATAASLVLELAIYDTQCGAKLFRANAEAAHLFAYPFLSKWVFDVEIIARTRRVYGATTETLHHLIYEFPLEAWEDVAGSKVKPIDFVHAFVDLVRIRFHYPH